MTCCTRQLFFFSFFFLSFFFFSYFPFFFHSFTNRENLINLFTQKQEPGSQKKRKEEQQAQTSWDILAPGGNVHEKPKTKNQKQNTGNKKQNQKAKNKQEK